VQERDLERAALGQRPEDAQRVGLLGRQLSRGGFGLVPGESGPLERVALVGLGRDRHEPTSRETANHVGGHATVTQIGQRQRRRRTDERFERGPLLAGDSAARRVLHERHPMCGQRRDPS
jgi:hypothetical protein